MAYVPPSDWELKDFIRDHADAVFRSCGFLTVGRGDALTMTREIFRKILNQGMEFRSEREARAWMILTAYQLGKKTPKGEQQPEQGKELMKLSRKDRLIALLYYCEGYRKKEIADFLGCTEASVRRRLRRVKRRLDVDGDPEDAPSEEAEEQQTDLPEETKPEAEEAPGQEEAPQDASSEEAPAQEPDRTEDSLQDEQATEDAPQTLEAPEEAPEEAKDPEEAQPQAQTGGEKAC